jgi:hypothetical protein
MATPNYPDYSPDGLTGWVPKVFSIKANKKFYDESIIAQIANTDWENEIKGFGSEVSIPNIPDIAAYDLPEGAEYDWETPSADAVVLQINKRKAFSFRMDTMTLKQLADKDMMNKFSSDAAKQVDKVISKAFLADIYLDASDDNQGATAGVIEQSYDLGVTGAPIILTKSNIIDYLIWMGVVGDEQNWDDDNRKLTLPSVFCGLLKQSDLKDASMTGDGQSTLRTGRIGILDRWEIFRSNLYTSVTDVAAGSITCYNVVFNHKSAITYAGQLKDVTYYDKFENFPGKGMAGTNLHGWKVNNPLGVGVLYASKG